MLPDDAFWATKIVARFSDDAVRALVHRGIYLDREAERYLADTIIKRRDKIVAHYFRQLNPLDAFRVVGSSLLIRNLGEEEGLATVQAYEYEWYVLDNDTEALTLLNEKGEKGETARPELVIPESDEDYLMVRIRTRSEDEPKWRKAVDVYLRNRDGRSVVGIEREI
jgi:hypothetical protein